MLNRRNIKTTRPVLKFDDKLLGPFKVLAAVGSHAYRVDIGNRRVHNVFHVDLLHPYRNPAQLAGRPVPPPPPPPVLPDDDAYEVSEVLDSRLRRGKLQYLVRWEGYSAEHDSWVSASDFDDDDSLPLAFHRVHPGKPYR